MESLEAMDHIDRMFLTIDESLWLPQWSFDFWIIPYMLGMGVSSEQFKQFLSTANKLLALNIASVPDYQKGGLQKEYMQGLIKVVDGWNVNQPIPLGAASPADVTVSKIETTLKLDSINSGFAA